MTWRERLDAAISRCPGCGHQWTPTPARGTTTVTANRLDTETAHHFTTCKPTTPATIGPS